MAPESPLVDCEREPRPSPEGRFGVHLVEKPFRGHFNLRLDPTDPGAVDAARGALEVALPLKPNTVATGRLASVLWLGPDEWLALCEPEDRAALGDRLTDALAPFRSAVNDIGGGQTIVFLSGPHAPDVLRKGCPLDIHPRVFPPGACAQTRLAKTAVVLRPLPSNQPAFDIVVRRSFADYLWRWLRLAATEYGSTG